MPHGQCAGRGLHLAADPGARPRGRIYIDVKRALDNIAVRSRHVGTELVRVAKDIEKAAP